MAEERTGGAAVLVGLGSLLCLGAVYSVARGVGALVPAVGDLLGAQRGGAGDLAGALVGAVLLGGVGFAMVVVGRKDTRRANAGTSLSARSDEPDPRRPDAASSPVRLPLDVQAAEDLLPHGPGLLPRWLVAVPLMVVAVVSPVFGHLVLSAWASVSFHDGLPAFDGSETTFWTEFRENLHGYTAGMLVVPAVVLAVFLLRRGMFAAWPKACLLLGSWILGPSVLLNATLASAGTLLPNIAIGVGVLGLVVGLGHLTLRVLSRPVARDIVRSELEIPYSLPDSRVRLRIRRDHLRLDRLRAEKGRVHKVVAWADLSAVRLERLTEPTEWQASSGTRIMAPAGPVLFVTSAGEEWLVPVTDEAGEDLAAAITLRVSNKP